MDDSCNLFRGDKIVFSFLLKPNIIKVNASIVISFRLVEKLQIHCQEEKAQWLDKLVSRFLDLPAFEWREGGKVRGLHNFVLCSL